MRIVCMRIMCCLLHVYTRRSNAGKAAGICHLLRNSLYQDVGVQVFPRYIFSVKILPLPPTDKGIRKSSGKSN